VIVVSDSSPLIILAKLDRFELLNKLFSRVYVSAEVYREVVVLGSGRPGASEVANAPWIEIHKLTGEAALSQKHTAGALGAGELATILLAKQLRANFVLLDDHKARVLARAEGLKPLGSVGLLETFYARGYLADLRAAFQALLSHNAYIDPRLLNLRLKSLKLPSI
jgi:uncharacterized protein